MQLCIETPADLDADFDADIALALVASGWRASAALLTHAAMCIEAGDLLAAERNRQIAREQFVVANDAWRQFMEFSGHRGPRRGLPMNGAPFPPTFASCLQPRLRAAVSLSELTFSRDALHSAGAASFRSRMMTLMNWSPSRCEWSGGGHEPPSAPPPRLCVLVTRRSE